MTARKKPAKRNLLANRTASVGIHRNGLSITIESVPAVDSGQVAAALLDAVRDLIEVGYEELIAESGSIHGGALGDFPDEDGIEEAVDTPSMRRKRPIGFVV